jgi:RNA polymerase sigma factor (sigma-70 family)
MTANAKTLIHHIRRLAKRPELDDDSDAALLRRYVSQRDAMAFAALVERHGPLVWNVCRRALGDAHDAEDAFQAAFLVLFRKADTLRSPDELAGWLHGVAHRVAMKARAARLRQSSEKRLLAEEPAEFHPDPLAELSARELLTVLDEEVQRLPAVYRLPVVLCYLEGRSQEEAARQLGWSAGSVKGRLERGRARLHHRLARRGLTLAAVLTAAEVTHSTASSHAVAALVGVVVRSASTGGMQHAAAAGVVSAQAQALAGEVARGVSPFKITGALGLVLATCLTATGLLFHKITGAPLSTPETERTARLHNQTQQLPRNRQAEGIEVTGRVFDPAGKPLAGAKLYVGYTIRPRMPLIRPRQINYPLRATSAADGSFHFRFALSELTPKWLNDLRPAVLASAAGYGPDWVEIGESVQRAKIRLRLVADGPAPVAVIKNNRLVPGCKLTVHGISDHGKDMERILQRGGELPSIKHWVGPLPGREETITTGADGSCRVYGFGLNRSFFAGQGQAIQNTYFTMSEARIKSLEEDRSCLVQEQDKPNLVKPNLVNRDTRLRTFRSAAHFLSMPWRMHFPKPRTWADRGLRAAPPCSW